MKTEALGSQGRSTGPRPAFGPLSCGRIGPEKRWSEPAVARGGPRIGPRNDCRRLPRPGCQGRIDRSPRRAIDPGGNFLAPGGDPLSDPGTPGGNLGCPAPSWGPLGGPDAEKGRTSCAMSRCAFCRRNCANRKSAARFVRAMPISSFCGLRPLANGGGGGRNLKLGELFSALSCPPNSSCPSKESRTCLVPH